MASTKGRVKVFCKCGKSGFITRSEQSCLEDDGLKWMCARCDERETIRINSLMAEEAAETLRSAAH